MKDPASEWIRHLAAPESGPFFASAHFERDVFVWDLAQSKLRMHLETKLDFGGVRLAMIGGERPLVIVGAYRGGGVSAFDILAGGLKVWHRPDLKQVQVITVCESSRRIGVGLEKGPAQILSSQSGMTLFKVSRSRSLHFPPGQEAVLAQGRKGLDFLRLPFQKNEGRFDLSSWLVHRILPTRHGIYTLGFAEEEVDNPLCLALDSYAGRRMWEIRVPFERSAGNMAWDSGAGLLRLTTDYELLSVDQDGAIVHRASLPSHWEAAFLAQGSLLALSDGTVRSVETGEIVWSFVQPPVASN